MNIGWKEEVHEADEISNTDLGNYTVNNGSHALKCKNPILVYQSFVGGNKGRKKHHSSIAHQ